MHDRREAQLPVTEGPRLLIGGAGAPRRTGFLTVDLVATRDVDLVSNVEQLAIRDGSVGAIECDAVLEHVSDPRASVHEFHRVLRSGGWLHVVVPFNHPFHAYPRDFQRWTIDGLTRLLERFEVVKTGVRTGPTATLLTFALEYAKVVAPGPLKRPVYAALGWIVWPLRGLDRWLNRRPDAHVLANSIYALVRKR
jgi:SAM-dependent methyltransferase